MLLGVPAGLLLRRQTETQMHALMDQASQTTLALYGNKATQLQNFSLLIVERPTLNRILFEDENFQALDLYLDDFLDNSGMDAIVVCAQNMPLAVSGVQTARDLCIVEEFNAITIADGEAWMLARAALPGVNGSETYVVVGQLADAILGEFREQSSLEYLLFHEGILLDLTNQQFSALLFQENQQDVPSYQTVIVNNETGNDVPFMTVDVPLPGDQAFDLIGFMNIETFVSLNRQMRNLILASVLLVTLIGTGIAVFISQRISKPLNQIALSAAALREGDLTTPLSTSSKIWEIDQLTNALEDTRVGLKHSLDQLRTDKLWIESLLNAIVEGLLTIDEKHRITFISQAIEHMLDMDPSHILGKHLDDLFVVVSGEESFSQQIPSSNQGRRIPVWLHDREVLLNVSVSSFVPLEAGNATRALVIRDVTDEERIHRLIGEFMANITHEFRTPLSALSASVELLVDQLPDLSTQEIIDLLHALNIGIIDLQSLIDNLIEAASIESGRFKVNPRKVALSSITQRAIETVEPIIRKHGLNLVVPKSKQSFLVIADERRTSQALINLLSNAIKHSPEGGRITLRTLIMGKEVLVEVQDEGIGVEPERQSKLFNRFMSPDPEQDFSRIGMGLGLSVVKAIIETQGGQVGYKESQSGGAIFWFTMPMASGSDA